MYGYMCIFCTREEFNTVPCGINLNTAKCTNRIIFTYLRKFFILFFVFNFKFFITLLKYTTHAHTSRVLKKTYTHGNFTHTRTLNVQKKHYHIYMHTRIYTHHLSRTVCTQTHTHSTGYF